MRILVLEGESGIGKTTVYKRILENKGFRYNHILDYSFVPRERLRNNMQTAISTWLSLLIILIKHKILGTKTLLLDRSYISNYVYGCAKRSAFNERPLNSDLQLFNLVRPFETLNVILASKTEYPIKRVKDTWTKKKLNPVVHSYAHAIYKVFDVKFWTIRYKLKDIYNGMKGINEDITLAGSTKHMFVKILIEEDFKWQDIVYQLSKGKKWTDTLKCL